jgi:hypothetical protein
MHIVQTNLFAVSVFDFVDSGVHFFFLGFITQAEFQYLLVRALVIRLIGDKG